MKKSATDTRNRILAAASSLLYAEGIGRVSMDAVAAKAGVTKRTLYYHFRSKDDLIAAYLDGRDQPNLLLFQRWFNAVDGTLAERVREIFKNLAVSARHPKWKGCGFLRTTAELAHMPGHPAIKVGIGHKKRLEDWICESIEADGIKDGRPLARQIMVLLDGSFAVTLLHREPSYIEAAGEAAASLVQATQAQPGGERRRRNKPS